MCSGRHGMRHQTSQPTSATRTSVTSAYRQVPANMPVVGVKGVVWYADLPGGCPTFTPTRAYDPADNLFYDNLPHDIVARLLVHVLGQQAQVVDHAFVRVRPVRVGQLTCLEVGQIPVIADGKHAFVVFREVPAHDSRIGQAEAAEVVHRGDEAPPPCRIESAAEQSSGDPVIPAPQEPGHGLQILWVGERPVRLLGGLLPMAPRAVERGEHEPVNHRVARAAFDEPWGELLLGVVVVGQRVYRVAHDSLLFLGPGMRRGERSDGGAS